MRRDVRLAPVKAAALLLCALCVCAEASAPPDTLPAAGPTDVLRSPDALFEWAGMPDRLDQPVAAYRVRIDGGEPFLTFQNRIALYGIKPGSHAVSVAAVDVNAREDPTPAVWNFRAEYDDLQEAAQPGATPQEAQLLQNGVASAVPADDSGGSDWFRIETGSARAVVHVVYRQENGPPGRVRIYADSAPLDEAVWIPAFEGTGENSGALAFAFASRRSGWHVRVEGAAAYRLTASVMELPAGIYRADEDSAPVRLSGQESSALILGDSDAAVRAALDIPSPRRLHIGFYRLGASGGAAMDAYAGGSADPSRLAARLSAAPANRQAEAAQTGAAFGEWLLRVQHPPEEVPAPYLIALRLETPANDETLEIEPNGTPASAGEVRVGGSARGTFSFPGDVDVYRFEAPSNGILALSFKGPLSAPASLRLMDRSGSVLTESTGGNLQADLAWGEYWIAAESTGAAYEPYALTPFFLYEMRVDADRPARETLPAGAVLRPYLKWRSGGRVWVEIDGIAMPAVPMTDAGGGAYEAALAIPEGAAGENLRLQARLEMDGAAASVFFPGQFSADGIPPRLDRVWHNASKPLKAGAVLTLRAEGEPNLALEADLTRKDGSLIRGGFLFNQNEMEPGVYEALITVQPHDQTDEGYVRVSAKDAAGNASVYAIEQPLRIDTVPPRIDSVQASVDGETVRVEARGESGAFGLFSILLPDEPLRTGLPLFEEPAGSGVYVGEYAAAPGEAVENAAVRAVLTDAAGNAAEAQTPYDLAFDAAYPFIERLTHNAPAHPMRVGDELNVALEGSPNADAAFWLVDADGETYRGPIPMLETEPGVYTGTYAPADGDLLEDGRVKAELRLSNGKTAERTSERPARLDAEPPSAVLGVSVEDAPGDEGGALLLNWQVSAGASRYRIFLSLDPITDISLAEEAERTDSPPALVLTESPGPFYAAVVAEDEAGNLSALRFDEGGSVAGPASPLDNLPPPPVRLSRALDRPGDDGGYLTAAWEASPAPDFLEYRVYLSQTPFDLSKTAAEQSAAAAQLPDRRLTAASVPTPLDGADLYAAVTAVDRAGNESRLALESVVGPTRSVPNPPPVDSGGLRILSGPFGAVHTGSAAFRWSRFADGKPIRGFRFKVDEGAYQYTASNEALLVDLPPGERLFSVEPADGSLPPAVRRFTFDPIQTREREPNSSPAGAQPAPFGAEIAGDLEEGGADWFRFHLSEAGPAGVRLTRRDAGQTRATLFLPFSLAEEDAAAQIFADGGADPHAYASAGLPPGELLVRVDGDPGPYELALSQSRPTPGAVWETEPNGTPLRANAVSGDAVEISGAANLPNDEDWFRWEETDGGERVWTVAAASGQIEFYQEIDGQLELFGELNGTAQTPPSSLAAGAYYIKAVGTGASPYQIRIEQRPAPDGQRREKEPNGSSQTALSLPLNAEIQGAVWGKSDQDWFSLSVDASAGAGVLAVLEGAQTTRLEALSEENAPVGLLLNAHAVWIPAEARALYLRVSSSQPEPYRLAAYWIERADHDGFEPIGLGGTLSAAMTAPSGWSVSAFIEGTAVQFPLLGDGAGNYAGSYEVQQGDDAENASLIVRVSSDSPALRFAAERPMDRRVTIDTKPPAIFGARHNADKPLRAGERVDISVRSETGAAAYAILTDGIFEAVVILTENEEQPGLYEGSYEARPGDAMTNGTATAYVEDAVGNLASRETPAPIDIDTTPPAVYSVRHDADSALGAGSVLTVEAEGEPGADARFHIEGVREDVPMTETAEGFYTGSAAIFPNDNAEAAVVTVVLVDAAGNEASLAAPFPAAIDTVPPRIDSVSHDADQPLAKGALLTVQLQGEPGGKASFDIGTARLGIPMFDDGAGADLEPFDGLYVGEYAVQDADHLIDQTVTGRLEDANGNRASLTAARRVTLDAVAPAPVMALRIADAPNDQGNVLTLTWEWSGDARDIHRFYVYRETYPILSVRGLIPAAKWAAESGGSSYTLNLDAPVNNADYYAAVIAVDSARNESALLAGESSAGPAAAVDNIRPAGPSNAAAEDAPNDQGGRLLATWTPGPPEPDFEAYVLYVTEAPLSDPLPPDLRPAAVVGDSSAAQAFVPTPVNDPGESNRQGPFYVTILTRDVNGNLSPARPELAAGPVYSTDDIPPEAVAGVAAEDAPSDRGGILIVSWNDNDDPTIYEYRVYLTESPARNGASLEGVQPALAVPRLPNAPRPSVVVETPANDVPFYVTVAASDGSAGPPAVGVGSTAGPVRSVVNEASTDRAVLIRAGFDARAAALIPAGAAPEGAWVNIVQPVGESLLQAMKEANANLARANIDDAFEEELRGTARLFVSNVPRLFRPATVTLGFPALPVSGDSAEAPIMIFRLNADAVPARWELLSDKQEADMSAGTVSAETREFGLFRAARLKLPASFDRVVVYPNPFRLGGLPLRFENLPRGAEVAIYTLDGRLVRRLEKSLAGAAEWDGRTRGGDLAATGLYLYSASTATGRRFGQIFVIR